jgi:hypothetical protein
MGALEVDAKDREVTWRAQRRHGTAVERTEARDIAGKTFFEPGIYAESGSLLVW